MYSCCIKGLCRVVGGVRGGAKCRVRSVCISIIIGLHSHFDALLGRVTVLIFSSVLILVGREVG